MIEDEGIAMIVVNVSQSYAALLRRERPQTPWEFHNITVGDWPPMSEDTLEEYRDYLVGTYNDMIVTAFKIISVNRIEKDGKAKLEFVVDGLFNPGRPADPFNLRNPEDEAAWLIGCPIPGGPWKRGEARGTRRYSLDAYLKDHPEFSVRRDAGLPGSMASNLFELLRGDHRIPSVDFPALEAASAASSSVPPAGGVTISRRPDGTVVVVIPTGTRAQITVDPEADR